MSDQSICSDLKAVLRRLKLSGMLETLPERIELAWQQGQPYQDFLLLVLGDEASRRDSQAVTMRARKARLDANMRFECWDDSARIDYDRPLLNELVSLRFVEAGRHVAIVGPVGVGKTFIAHALGHIACRHRRSVLAVRADRMLKTLRHARVDGTYEQEFRRLLAVDVLIIDDFALDPMDATESRDVYDLIIERHRAGSMIITSNRGPDEWLGAFCDPVRGQSAVDRFTSNAYDLVIEGESYRQRLKPRVSPGASEEDTERQ